MAHIEFVVPEAVINYFENPRFGSGDTTGLTLVGSVLTNVTERARFGPYSVRVNCNGAAANEGCYATVAFAFPGLAADQVWCGSVYLRGEGIVRLRLRDNTNAVETISDSVELDDIRWRRVYVVCGVEVNCMDLRLYIETTTIQDVTFWVDGVQFEQNEYMTSYADGDLELEIPPHDGYVYYKWNGTRHASTSLRSAECRLGGKTELMDNEDVDVELLITETTGLGMAPINLHLSQYATLDRARIEGWKAQPRTVTLLFHARRSDLREPCYPADLYELHKARQKLEAIVKPDLSPNAQPLLMRYSDEHDWRKFEMWIHYEGGLEWTGDIRAPFVNEFAVRFIAADPYWYEDTVDVYEPTGYSYLPDADYIVARIDGEWTEVGDADDNVKKINVHPVTGDVYVGGDFSTIDGVTANTAYIARWDGEAWHSCGGAGNALNGDVDAIDFLADGTVIVGGEFTTFGATTCNCIAIYDPVTDTWVACGPAAPDCGFDDPVLDFTVRDDGNVYVVGQFQNSGNLVTTYNATALYDPVADTFAQMGGGANPGLNNTASCCSMDNNGVDVYIGGIFTTFTGGGVNALDEVTFYTADDDTFNAMGTGLDTHGTEYVDDILCTHDNRVYIGTEADHVGYVDVGYIAVWNGEEWYPLGVEGDGFTLDAAATEAVRCLHENYKHLLFIGGDVDGATGSPLSRGFSSWDRSRFQQWDLVMPTNHVYTIATKWDDIWIGFNNNGSSYASEVFTVENIGKTVTYPILEILGPCYLEWLENQTTGQIVRFDYDILADERVIIDFRPWNRFVRSSLRRHPEKAILPDSDDLWLLPGDNKLAMFCENVGQETEISLRWPIIHWSHDDLR